MYLPQPYGTISWYPEGTGLVHSDEWIPCSLGPVLPFFLWSAPSHPSRFSCLLLYEISQTSQDKVSCSLLCDSPVLLCTSSTALTELFYFLLFSHLTASKFRIAILSYISLNIQHLAQRLEHSNVWQMNEYWGISQGRKEIIGQTLPSTRAGWRYIGIYLQTRFPKGPRSSRLEGKQACFVITKGGKRDFHMNCWLSSLTVTLEAVCGRW